MDKNEFNNRKTEIKNCEEIFNQNSNNLNNTISKSNIEKNISSYLQNLNTLQDTYEKYINLLSEFQYSDNLTVSNNVFPGIRSINPNLDTNKLNNITNTMKSYVDIIKTSNNNINLQHVSIIQQLKSLIKQLSDLKVYYDNLITTDNNLISDIDSVYNIL